MNFNMHLNEKAWTTWQGELIKSLTQNRKELQKDTFLKLRNDIPLYTACWNIRSCLQNIAY